MPLAKTTLRSASEPLPVNDDRIKSRMVSLPLSDLIAPGAKPHTHLMPTYSLACRANNAIDMFQWHLLKTKAYLAWLLPLNMQNNDQTNRPITPQAADPNVSEANVWGRLPWFVMCESLCTLYFCIRLIIVRRFTKFK